MKRFLIVLSLTLLSWHLPAGNPNKEIDKVIKTLWKTSLYDVNADRLGAMNTMQGYMDACTSKEFVSYLKLQEPHQRRAAEEGKVEHYYQAAMDKLVQEIPSAQVRAGSVVIWHLYNMGYVVKTPSHCFAVDIKHPEADRLVPYIEFLLITHKHGDHYTDKFNEAMIASGKKVYTNWDAKSYKTANLTEVRKLDLGDIKLETLITDHNSQLTNFVICYRVDCGADTGHTVFLFAGDTNNSSQLEVTQPVDIFVPHLAVGLDMQDACARVKPETVLVSHIQELAHRIDQWRWSYWLGMESCWNINNNYGSKAYLPVWGEKFEYAKPSAPALELVGNLHDWDPAGVDAKDWGWVQGLAVWGDFAFVCHDGGLCAVYNLKAKRYVNSFRLPGQTSHCNNAFFGWEKYDSNSKSPMLYVSDCVDCGKCYVYDVTVNDARLVQTIHLKEKPAGEDGGNGWYCDSERHTLCMHWNNRYWENLVMPSGNEPDPVVSVASLEPDGLMALPATHQGACRYKGITYFPCGFDENPFLTVKCNGRSADYPLTEAGCEPEGICGYGGYVYVTFCKNFCPVLYRFRSLR